MEKEQTISIQEIAKNQLDITKKVYLLSPNRMFSEFKGEKENVKNYNNRQLLEMLQNADDAASEAKKEKKVLIKLTGKKLIIANTGYGFSEEGLNSIFHSHLSPKEAMEGQIGKKGLGFRSILSWAKKVTIDSHDLCVGFSKDYSKKVLFELLQNQKFKTAFEKLKNKEEFPISTLVCPEVEGAVVDYFEGKEDFDTIIQIDLLDNAIEQVIKQLSQDIDSEVLLFLNNLTSIYIDINGIQCSYKKENISKDILKIINTTEESVTDNIWNIYNIEGKFEDIKRDYHLSVAWQNDFVQTKDVVYSYFRTKVPIQCKGIIHGSFELNADRNLIIDDEEDYNKKLTALIPYLLTEASEKIAQIENDNFNFKSVSFLQADFQSLNHLADNKDLKNNILNLIKDKNIFPVTSNQYIKWDNDNKPVYFVEQIIPKYLNPDQYPDLLLHTEDEFVLNFLENLGYENYNVEVVIPSIAAHRKDINLPDYALLIKSIGNYIGKDTELLKTEGVFFDNEKNLLSFDKPIFLPNQGVKYNLPHELGIQIISNDLAAELLKVYQCSDFKNLAEALSKYNLKEFNFNEVVEALISHYSQHEEVSLDDVKNLHKTLFDIYKLEPHTDSNWKGTAIHIINKKNKIELANKLYFGKEYGNPLAEEIYSYDKAKLIASHLKFEIEALNTIKWKKYIEWLGVAYYPRKETVRVKDDYADYVMKNYNYRNSVGDYTFKKGYKQFKDTLTGGYGPVNVLSIDDFDKILLNNTSESIINLIDKDLEIFNSIDKNIEPHSSLIYFDFFNTRNYRKINGSMMTSYIKWKLEHSTWLQTEAVIKTEPSKCSSAAYINEEFSGLIEKPKVDYDVLKSKQVQREKVDYILSLVGVHKTINTLSPEMIYTILHKLPEIDPSGKKAKTIYNQIAVNYDEKALFKISTLDREYKNYMTSGRVFCKDGVDYPLNEVYYVNDKRYGETVIKQFNIIEIERRRGKDKIKKIFGVQPLDNIDLNVVGIPEVHTLNSKFELEIENFKPYVYVLRKEQDSGNEKNIIKNTKFQLVSNLTATLSISGQQKIFELDDFEYLYIKKRNIIFIKVPIFFDEIIDLKESIFFCSTIAEVFSAILDVDAQRLQIRELFSKSASVRDELLRSETDDINLEKLNDARKKLGVISNPKIDFWKAFVKCFKNKTLNIKTDTDQAILEALMIHFPKNQELILNTIDFINYQDLNEEVSAELIINLFKRTGITISQFNTFHYPSINISLLYEINFKEAVNDNLEKFKSILYDFCLANKLPKNRFLEMVNTYLNLTSEPFNEVNFDVISDLKTITNELFEIDLNAGGEIIDWSVLYALNTEKVWEMVKTPDLDKKLFNQFIQESYSIQSLLFFENEFPQIDVSFKTWLGKNIAEKSDSNTTPSKSNRIVFGKEPIFYNDLLDLKKQIDNLLSDVEIKKIGFANVKIAKKDIINGKGSPSGSGRSRGLNTKKPKEEIGFLGEYIVYKHLLEISENKSDVKWVSGYAKDCGVNLDGVDGLGYDLMYLPKGAKHSRKVEVKVVGWEDAFHITSNEVKVGERLKRNYEVFLVRNIDNISELKIEKIQGLFDYKGKSFTDNELFTVVNDNFILKFKKAN
ncbi:sacsin N-terminal ATP-binding-like domain-containing protein [Flavobacterium sp. Root420]|uniref:sacsin N-terminal ATP-binding-like domain-containing protein n=1 Tax=Flavobacterium sp. Root420 TaxID=1736533 RepID=UPI0006F832EA|nr:DUF3883 domain-containing protein [Flavobacterium sp. Root420]KQX00765.1 hypothetical protein ASC72_07835 [Flavobacterium sp. Root420]